MSRSGSSTPVNEVHGQEKVNLSDNAIQNLAIAQLDTLEQVKELVATTKKISSKEPIPSEAIWNFILQILGLIAAALFGVFSVLAWKDGKAANEAGSQANQLAFKGNLLSTSQNCLAGAANRIAIHSACEAVETPLRSAI